MQKFHKRSRQSDIHLHLVISVYQEILKSSKYGHLVIMATLFWPPGITAIDFLVKKNLGNTVNVFFDLLVIILMGFHYKMKLKTLESRNVLLFFSYLPIYIVKI